MSAPTEKRILLTGATGFVGRHLYPRLIEQGWTVRCGTRSVERARRTYPDRDWVEFDVQRPETLGAALRGCDSTYYLVHQMAGGEGFAARERRAAYAFLDAATRAGLERIVYLGGVEPAGTPSEHLQSRLQTGWILRGGDVSTIELRASMIIGSGSASFQIVRDLAARLPLMLLPAWTQSRTEPLYIDDAVEALIGAMTLPIDASQWFDIPGPEALTIEEILLRTGALLGHQTRRMRIPLLTPKLSSYWLHLLTSADYEVAHSLVKGLSHDLLAVDDDYWELIDHRERLDFDEAMRRALADNTPPPAATRAVERVVGALTSRSSPRRGEAP